MTRVPVPSGVNTYFHTIVPAAFSVRVKANSRPRSATVMTGVLDQSGPRPAWFLARKRTPTAGAVAPSSHSQATTSGERSGVLVTSAMTS